MTEEQKRQFKRIVENGRIRVDCMDALLILIAEIEQDPLDLARNVAGIDLDGLDLMSRETMRATILEYREQAQRALKRNLEN